MTNEEYITNLRLTLDDFARAVQVGYNLAKSGRPLPEVAVLSVYREDLTNEELGILDDERVKLLSSQEYHWIN